VLVGDAVSVGVFVGTQVPVGVLVGVPVGGNVPVGVSVGVSVGVGVFVGVGVSVGGVGVSVGGVGVSVGGVGVSVGGVGVSVGGVGVSVIWKQILSSQGAGVGVGVPSTRKVSVQFSPPLTPASDGSGAVVVLGRESRQAVNTAAPPKRRVPNTTNIGANCFFLCLSIFLYFQHFTTLFQTFLLYGVAQPLHSPLATQTLHAAP